MQSHKGHMTTPPPHLSEGHQLPSLAQLSFIAYDPLSLLRKASPSLVSLSAIVSPKATEDSNEDQTRPELQLTLRTPLGSAFQDASLRMSFTEPLPAGSQSLLSPTQSSLPEDLLGQRGMREGILQEPGRWVQRPLECRQGPSVLTSRLLPMPT